MHKKHMPAEPAFEATVLDDEQARTNQLLSTDGSNRPSEYSRPSIEMAVEWAHLGGD
ncbi:MAG TPA: hypothetical protein VG453_01510 [Nitrospira sp.]|nr:hypothetical protein [Nitrospira sp.]